MHDAFAESISAFFPVKTSEWMHAAAALNIQQRFGP